MNLNKSLSSAPVTMDMNRSKFPLNWQHTTSMSEGDIVPFYLEEVLPGDTFSLTNSFVARMATPIFPVMGNANVDISFFFVPNRLVWDHWKAFMGEAESSPWKDNVEYTIPQLEFVPEKVDGACALGARPGTLANYLGVPLVQSPMDEHSVNTGSLSVSDLPNRAYRLIYNEWFRNQNLEAPIYVPTDDSDRIYGTETGILGDKYGKTLLRASRKPDPFSMCLPQPQRGDPVYLPLGSLAPVIFGDEHMSKKPAGQFYDSVKYRDISGDVPVGKLVGRYADSNQLGQVDGDLGSISIQDAGSPLVISNAWADLENATSATVNSIRQAFAIQRLFERSARSGGRYREMVKAAFGTTIPDSTVQIPEYLGGQSVPIGMQQVVQTSATNDVSPQGNTSAFSVTSNLNHAFTKSFNEHGMIIGVAVIRVNHLYSQGIAPFLSRKRRFDFYDPTLANLGEMPVTNRQIYATGDEKIDNEVFGYQEAWYDYRYHTSRLSGAFSPDWSNGVPGQTNPGIVESPLAQAWTYADFYESLPTLSTEWCLEDRSRIQKTLAVENEPQFIVDHYFDVTVSRVMPVYSIPGLIDHH